MTTPAVQNDDHAWEKENAPRVSRAYLLLTVVVWFVWFAFLVGIAVNRWFGSLQ